MKVYVYHAFCPNFIDVFATKEEAYRAAIVTRNTLQANSLGSWDDGIDYEIIEREVFG